MKVEQALLALRLHAGWDGQESARATLLLRSLERYWTGRKPLALRIICPESELDEVRALIARVPDRNVWKLLHSEGEFFEPSSPFHRLAPRYRQQLIKLVVPTELDMGCFITLDADVACVRHIDEGTFVRDERLLTQWEPRDRHAWWRQCAAVLDLPANLQAPGISVTPNVLSTDLCADVFRHLSEQHTDPVDYLCQRSVPATVTEQWTEYTLYTLVAEHREMLGRHHLAAEHPRGGPIHSRRSVWYPFETNLLGPDPVEDAYFLVVQSRVRVPLPSVYERVPELAGLAD